MVDPHTIATFAFAQMRRDPDFGRQFSWIRDTVVCVESDLADDVLNSQVTHYFGDTGGTIACYYPRDKRFMFIHAGAPVKPADAPEPTPGERQFKDSRERPMTIGELVNAIYERMKGDYSHLPVWLGDGIEQPPQAPMFGEASTVEIEKTLTLA